MAAPIARSVKARADIFPCGYCNKDVSWSDLAVCCDACDIWYHKSCHSLNVSKFEDINDVSWQCFKCQTILVNSFSYHSYELDSPDNVSQNVHSAYISTSSISSPSSSSLNNIIDTENSPHRFVFGPTSHSTPESQSIITDCQTQISRSTSNLNASHSTRSTDSDTSPLLTDKKRNWKTTVLNANGLNSSQIG